MIRPIHGQHNSQSLQSTSEVKSKETLQETSTQTKMLENSDRVKQLQTNNRLPLGAGHPPCYDNNLNNPEQAQRAWVAFDRTLGE